MASSATAMEYPVEPNTVTEDSVSRPYRAEVTIEGIRPLLFHRYDTQLIADKSALKKGSKAKKTDNVESSVYLSDEGTLSVPGLNFHSALIAASKFHSDPRSPRASAKELFKCGILVVDDLAEITPPRKTWDFEDARRVRVQNSYITRVRPGIKKGWKLTFTVDVALPEYITPGLLQEVVVDAGRYCGICDFRPVFGRFSMTGFKVLA